MKTLIFDCFGVLVVPRREFSNLSEIFENRWTVDEKLVNFLQQERLNDSKIAVLSNVAQYEFDRFFSREEQVKLFDAVLLSGNLGVSKPDLRIFEIACEQLGEKPEDCIFVDDLSENVISAKEIGMRGVGYSDFERFLGFYKQKRIDR